MKYNHSDGVAWSFLKCDNTAMRQSRYSGTSCANPPDADVFTANIQFLFDFVK